MLNLSSVLCVVVRENGRRLRHPCPFGTLGRRIQVEGEGELPPNSQRGFYEASPLEPLLKVEVGGLLSLSLCVFHALQLNPG
jgi:hypothetical protein